MTEVLKKDKRAILFECVYYVYFALLLFLQFMETTMIDISAYRQIIKFALLFFGIILVAKIAVEWTSAWNVKAIIVAIVGVIFILLPVLNYMMDLTIGFCILLLASRNISSKRTLTLYVLLSTALTIFVIAYCLTGKVENFTVYRDEVSNHKRQALGFIYATYLSAHIMGIVTVWAYIRGKAISWVETIIISGLGIYTYYLTESRITCAVIVITGVIMAFAKFFDKKSIKIKLVENRIIKWILVLSSDIIALFAILMGLIYRYDSTFFEKLNKLSSQRLWSNALTFDRYDVTLWGQRITFVGDYTSGQRGVADNYYMQNCSYILILFKWGIIGLLAVLFGWTLITYRAAKKEEYFRVLLLDALSVYFFFEQRMYIFCIVPFWILLLSDKEVEFFDLSSTKIYKCLVKHKNKIKWVLSMAVIAVVIDLVGFNKDVVMTLMNEPLDIKEATMDIKGLKQVIDGKYMIDKDTQDGGKTKILLANLFTPVGVDSFKFGINFYESNEAGDYQYVDNVDYSYELYSLQGDGQFHQVAIVECDSNKPITWYTSLNESAAMSSFIIIPHIDDKYMFDVMNLDFNGPVPYDFNPGRLALIWLILSALALVLSSGKKPENKDDEGSEDDSKEEITDNTEADTSKEDVEEETESTTEAEKV